MRETNFGFIDTCHVAASPSTCYLMDSYALLATIKDQQTAILKQNASINLSLRALVTELRKLSERVILPSPKSTKVDASTQGRFFSLVQDFFSSFLHS
jgi:hypothetical protein